MAKLNNDLFIEVCESEGWTVEEDFNGYFISQYSPAGEDFGFYVSLENAFDDAFEYFHSFDPDEHCEMWIESRGKNGVPRSISVLIDDAWAICDMLEKLGFALLNAWKKDNVA